LLDLEALKKAVGVKQTNPHDGLQIKEINPWGDQIAPRSERLWTLSLDGDPIRAAEGQTEFRFPLPKAQGQPVVYQTYDDMNLAVLPQPAVMIGGRAAHGAGAAPQNSHLALWFGLGSAVVSIVGGIVLVRYVKRREASAQTASTGETFKMPGEVDGFAVVALLRRLRTSPQVRLGESQRQELQQDLLRIQQTCFGAAGSALPESDLRGIAEKWLRAAL
jgi:hypothetical protein